MTDTPRTDAHAVYFTTETDVECSSNCHLAVFVAKHADPVEGDYAPVNFARDLERELTAAKARVGELEGAISDAASEGRKNGLREAADICTDEGRTPDGWGLRTNGRLFHDAILALIDKPGEPK